MIKFVNDEQTWQANVWQWDGDENVVLLNEHERPAVAGDNIETAQDVVA